MSIDVVDILKKGRSVITSLEIETEAVRAERHPKSLLSIHYHLRVSGNGIAEDQLKRAIELSLTKFCSVALSIDRAVKFTAQFTINDVAGEPWEVNRLPLPHYP
jgi:putative redox protein